MDVCTIVLHMSIMHVCYTACMYVHMYLCIRVCMYACMHAHHKLASQPILQLAKWMGIFNGFQQLICTNLRLEFRRSDSHLFCKSQYESLYIILMLIVALNISDCIETVWSGNAISKCLCGLIHGHNFSTSEWLLYNGLCHTQSTLKWFVCGHIKASIQSLN